MKLWALQNHIKILPSVPHEHDTVRKVERLHRTASEMVVKYLANKPHLSSNYWGFAYLHCIDLINIGSGSKNTPSPYYSWHNKALDFKLTPVLPFGSVIAAHRPLAEQTTLSGRSIEAIFIGIAHSHINAVLLFNPITKRTFVRHSFKYLSDELPPTSYTDVYFTNNPSSTSVNPVFEAVPSVDDNSGDFSYVPISIAQAPAAIKFAFSHLNNTFVEKSTNTT